MKRCSLCTRKGARKATKAIYKCRVCGVKVCPHFARSIVDTECTCSSCMIDPGARVRVKTGEEGVVVRKAFVGPTYLVHFKEFRGLKDVTVKLNPERFV